ncbi:Glycoside hydrolase family 76 protein [Mycena indigotica]|uniref:Glycoside hydrolase family 76 protein n=1 Tax=Mycena indigotica TaxID=2126181 RepID=A0A8H6RWZ8_9AGAR|nr:Glycoside hydrolase family 76 protein [Mycena indigotica]KAF7289325.1 Glycoside hydrolase family 76 protein [Mycena indigotica]
MPNYILAITSTTDVNDDEWLLRDTLMFKELLGTTTSNHSQWIVAIHPRQLNLVVGDRRSERSPDIRDGFTVVEPIRLADTFLWLLSDMLRIIPPDGRLILVVCGHGEEYSGNILVGPDANGNNPFPPLRKESVETFIMGANLRPDQVVVLSTACYSELWASPCWTLVCGAEHDQESVSIPMSISGHYRGGFLPYSRDNPDYCKETVVAVDANDPIAFPRPTLSAAAAWMEDFRRTIGGIADKYASTSARLPTTASFQSRLKMIPAVVAHEDPRAAPITLNPVDANTIVELKELSRRVLAHHFRNTGNAVPIMKLAWIVSQGDAATLTPPQQHRLLRSLRRWSRDCARAEGIAHTLGWVTTNPSRAEEWDKPHGVREMDEAQAAGARIREEFGTSLAIHRWSLGPGSWLAAAWRAMGRPMVEEADWTRAVMLSSI